jgi:hypothetical protein
VRTDDDEPSPEATRRAVRDVVGRCLYGGDVNPWPLSSAGHTLDGALEPGRPLSFLDAHIKCGNSLLGATPDLIAAGIPDDAFKRIEGSRLRRAWGLMIRTWVSLRRLSSRTM